MKEIQNKKSRRHRTFRLARDVDRWLEKTSARTGKTMTRLLEESCRARMILKGAVFLEEYRQKEELHHLVSQLVDDPAQIASLIEFIRTLLS